MNDEQQQKAEEDAERLLRVLDRLAARGRELRLAREAQEAATAAAGEERDG